MVQAADLEYTLVEDRSVPEYSGHMYNKLAIAELTGMTQLTTHMYHTANIVHSLRIYQH